MSSATARTFEFKDDKSSKFWEITLADTTVTVRYGKTGTNGQSQQKLFVDSAVAKSTSKSLLLRRPEKDIWKSSGRVRYLSLLKILPTKVSKRN